MTSPAWWWMVPVVAAVAARELDPAACAARFDVQRDKIIRTEESREMGARYLSELDVGARTECLRLCCETDACDVFVFEEKSPGSCYLFNCGPPEDFRCKFTAHGNFSSGVLAVGRRLAELQDQERLARHEQELANLRSPASPTASSTAAPAPSPRPAPSPQPPPPPPPPVPTGRCSRYQFECRRGGECIAVYNACDGVPQCADGSDEAPELGCPPSPAPPAAPPAAPLTAPLATPPTAPLAARPPPPPPPPAPQLTQVQAESADEGAGGELWPHRLAQAQLQHRYNGGASVAGGAAPGSHIFSHKGGLLQESAFEPPPAAGWPRRGWPPQTGMDGMSMSAPHAWGPYVPPDWDAESHRAWPVPPRPEPELPVYLPPKTMPEMPIMYSSQQQTLRDSPKKGFDLMTKSQLTAATEPPAAAPPAARDPGPDRREEKKPVPIENTTKKKMLKDSQSPEDAHRPVAGVPAGAGGAGGAVAMLAADEHDGLSERPPAAVLLLVLGSLLTAALGTLLACRARAARRRRRAHPRYALDADYLVNGMYL